MKKWLTLLALSGFILNACCTEEESEGPIEEPIESEEPTEPKEQAEPEKPNDGDSLSKFRRITGSASNHV